MVDYSQVVISVLSVEPAEAGMRNVLYKFIDVPDAPTWEWDLTGDEPTLVAGIPHTITEEDLDTYYGPENSGQYSLFGPIPNSVFDGSKSDEELALDYMMGDPDYIANEIRVVWERINPSPDLLPGDL